MQLLTKAIQIGPLSANMRQAINTGVSQEEFCFISFDKKDMYKHLIKEITVLIQYVHSNYLPWATL